MCCTSLVTSSTMIKDIPDIGMEAAQPQHTILTQSRAEHTAVKYSTTTKTIRLDKKNQKTITCNQYMKEYCMGIVEKIGTIHLGPDPYSKINANLDKAWGY